MTGLAANHAMTYARDMYGRMSLKLALSSIDAEETEEVIIGEHRTLPSGRNSLELTGLNR